MMSDGQQRLLQRTATAVTAHQRFAGLDFDTVVMDNSGTKQEHGSPFVVNYVIILQCLMALPGCECRNQSQPRVKSALG